jgi:hypothetical protein
VKGAVLVACGLLWSGCIASNVLDPRAREVAVAEAELAFAPAGDVVLDGLYESIDLRGEAAVSLRKIYYLFVADGTYTAAALAEVDGVRSFQTLSGRWRLEPRGLVLDDGAPVLLELAPDHLRLSAPTGVVVLARRSLR